jgi:hypothetical protein
MVAFATPPRSPNPWFEPEAVVVRPTPTRRPILKRYAARIGVIAFFGAALALVAQLPAEPPNSAVIFSNTRNSPEAEHFLRAVIGAEPTLSRVRKAMAVAQLTCQPAFGRGQDSLLVCLGRSVRFGGVYTRMAFRFVAIADSVHRVIVCPAMVLGSQPPPPDSLRAAASARLDDPACWRDPANRVHSDWTFASLPESERFTTVPIPDAPRMRAESDATRDTVRVIW